MSDLADRIRGTRRPGARKAGRDSRWPYVPVVWWTDPSGQVREKQVLARAFATRDEALACAEALICAEVDATLRKLGERRYRALREQYGLPREVPA